MTLTKQDLTEALQVITEGMDKKFEGIEKKLENKLTQEFTAKNITWIKKLIKK